MERFTCRRNCGDFFRVSSFPEKDIGKLAFDGCVEYEKREGFYCTHEHTYYPYNGCLRAQNIVNGLVSHLKKFRDTFDLPCGFLDVVYEMLSKIGVDFGYLGFLFHPYESVYKIFFSEDDERKFFEHCLSLEKKDLADELEKKKCVEPDIVKKFFEHINNFVSADKMLEIFDGMFGVMIDKLQKREVIVEERNYIIFMIASKHMYEGNYVAALNLLCGEDSEYFGSLRARIVENLHDLKSFSLQGGSAEDIILQLREL